MATAVTPGPVVPLPRCPRCGGAATHPPSPAGIRLTPDDDPAAVVHALAGWLDPLTGVVPAMVMDLQDDGLPIVATSAAPHVVAEDGSLRSLPVGWGKGLTVAGALVSAVGEAVERYSASLPDPERIVWAAAADLAGDRLDPGRYYTDEQIGRPGFPYVAYDPAALHPWVEGRWLDTGAPVWVPAVMAYLALDLKPQNLVCQGTSNGLAASTDADDASLRAILELVERDAFMTTWHTGTAARRLVINAEMDPMLLAIIEAVERLGGAVELHVLSTSACGTTVVAVARGDGVDWPGATIGLGTDLDPKGAVRQAVLELGQTGPYLRRLLRGGALTVPSSACEVRTMLDHAAFYFPAERASAFDVLRSSSAPVTLAELGTGPTRTLEHIAAALDAAGVRVALVDVTAADVATGPFRVVRAVSPDLAPLSYGYGLERLPVRRVTMRRPAGQPAPVHPVW